MTIQRIDNAAKRMHGWQARVPINAWHNGRRRYASAFYADRKHGGKRRAYELAREALARLS